MASQPERVASLETHRLWQWAALAAAAAWLSWASITLISIKGDMQAVKQKIKDGGLGDIVSQLKTPKSPQQLQASLAMVNAQIQTDRVNGVKPDPEKLNALSDALSQVVHRDPEIPEAWQAAVQLVDYKFQSSSPLAMAQPNCLDTLRPGNPEVDSVYTPTGRTDYPGLSGPQLPVWMSHVYLGHCTLSLDDSGNFDQSSVGKFFQNVRERHPQATLFVLVLNDAHITYSGGKMLPVTAIQFTNCSFEFTPPVGLPSSPTQTMTTQLLAENPPSGAIHLPPGI